MILSGVCCQGDRSKESDLSKQDDATPTSSTSNSTDNELRWSHSFGVYFQTDPPMEKESLWQENANILGNVLEDMEIRVSPTGFRMDMPGHKTNFTMLNCVIGKRIVGRIDDLGFQTLESNYSTFTNTFENGKFGTIDDLGLQTLETNYSTVTNTFENGKWTCSFPALQARRGDKFTYYMHFLFDEGDLNVKGDLDIEDVNLAISGSTTELIRCLPAPSGGGEAYRWSHQYKIATTYDEVLTNYSASLWLPLAERLKSKMEKDLDFYFMNSNLPGLMITIADDRSHYCNGDLSMFRVVALVINLNEEVKSIDAGHCVANVTMTASGWSFYCPGLTVKDGDKVFYLLRILSGAFPTWDNTVTGVVDIAREEGEESCPASFSVRPPPSRDVNNSLTWTRENHELDIRPTYPRPLEGEIGEKWRKDVQELKSALLDGIILNILEPAGLGISMSGNNMTILTFHVKLNEELPIHHGENMTQHKVDRWRFLYPDLKATEGDKFHYSMRVIFGTELWDIVINGKVEITRNTRNCTTSYNAGGGGAAPGPHKRVHGFRSRPAVVTPPPIASVRREGAVEGAFKWSHQVTIAVMPEVRLSEQTAPKWIDDAKLLRDLVEKHIEFTFSAKGLKIQFPGEDDTNLSIQSLYLDVNGASKYPDLDTSSWDTSPKVNNYPDITAKPGDKIGYQAYATLFPKHNIKGSVDITGP